MKNILFVIICSALFVLSTKAQDSTDLALTKRLGLTGYPLEAKIGLTYCFGSKGEIKIELAFEPDIEFKPFGVGPPPIETKLLYAWKSCRHKKLYSGLAVVFIPKTFFYEGGNALYGSVVPIGAEWFPFRRLKGVSVITEADIGYNPAYADAVDWRVHIGLCCYF